MVEEGEQDEQDLSDAPFSEEQRLWLQRQLSRWVKPPLTDGGSDQSSASTTGGASQDPPGE